MTKVRVNKGDLINILIDNKKAHKTEYDEAMKGWRDQCIKKLKDLLDSLTIGNSPDILMHESKPEDHTKDYDLALKMLNMSVDAVVEITNEQFSQFVNDDWDWRARWSVANSKYLSK